MKNDPPRIMSIIRITLFGIACCVKADASVGDVLTGMMRARSVTALRESVVEDETQRKFILMCEYQIKAQRIPLSCFKLSQSAIKSVLGRELSSLSRFCLDRVAESRDQVELSRALDLIPRRDVCWKAASERHADLVYQSEGFSSR